MFAYTFKDGYGIIRSKKITKKELVNLEMIHGRLVESGKI